MGLPLPSTDVKVVDPGTGAVLPPGVKGLVKARGPQVMKGYYKNPGATAAAIDSEGFFDTGDLGWVVPKSSFGAARNCSGQLVLDGRAKDTIVLANGRGGGNGAGVGVGVRIGGGEVFGIGVGVGVGVWDRGKGGGGRFRCLTCYLSNVFRRKH